MFDDTLMLRVNLPIVDSIHKFVTDVKIKATADSKLNDSNDSPAVSHLKLDRGESDKAGPDDV